MKYYLNDLYVVVDYGYHGEPDSDGYTYSSQEEAQEVADALKKASKRKQRVRVTTLQEYIWDNRRYTSHHCEIC